LTGLRDFHPAMHALDRFTIGNLTTTSPVLLSDFKSPFLNPVNPVNPVKNPPATAQTNIIRVFTSASFHPFMVGIPHGWAYRNEP